MLFELFLDGVGVVPVSVLAEAELLNWAGYCVVSVETVLGLEALLERAELPDECPTKGAT